MKWLPILGLLLFAGFAAAQIEFQTPLKPLRQQSFTPTAFAPAADGGQWVYVPTDNDGVLLKLNAFGEVTHKRRTYKLSNARFSADSTGTYFSYQDRYIVDDKACRVIRFDLELNPLHESYTRNCLYHRMGTDLILRTTYQAFDRISINGVNSLIQAPVSRVRPPYSYYQAAQDGNRWLLTLSDPGLELMLLDPQDRELSRTRVPYGEGEGVGFGTVKGIPLLFFQQPTQFGVARILPNGTRETLAQFAGPAINNIEYNPYRDAAISDAGHLFFSFGLFHSWQPHAVANSIVVVHPDSLETKRIDLPPQWYWGGEVWIPDGPDSILIYAQREDQQGQDFGAVFRVRFGNGGAAEPLLNLALQNSQAATLSRGLGGQYWLGAGGKTTIFDSAGQIRGEVRIPVDAYGYKQLVVDDSSGQGFIARSIVTSGPLALESYLEGRLVWRRIIDTVEPSNFKKVTAANQTLCASFEDGNPERARLMCFRQSDGSPLGELPEQFASSIGGWLIAPDGSFVGSYARNNLSYIVRWDFHSEPTSKQVSYFIGDLARFGPDGRLWMIDRNTPNKLVVVDAQDNVSTTTLPGYVVSMNLLNNDDAVLAYRKNSALHFERRNSQGDLRWTRVGATEDYPNLAGDPVLSNGSLYVVRTDSDMAFDGYSSQFMQVTKTERIDVQTSEEIWSKPYRTRGAPKLHVLNEQNLQLVTYQKRGVYVEAMNSHDGSILGGILNDFGGYDSGVDELRVLPNGKTLVRAEVDGMDTLVLLKSASALPAKIRLDQKAFSGIWFNPRYDGEGLMVQYFPAQRLLFAPWFYESSVKTTPHTESHIRWLTLSGELQLGAIEAQLQIYENRDGRFAQSPITQGRVVGTATMHALNCGEIIVKYEFERDLPNFEPPAYFGTMRLQRLAGDFANCERADGTTQIATQTRPAHAGFDTKQSGAWFNPETSGQGLMLTVQPPSTDSPSANGFFFGAWFTYDALVDPHAVLDYGSTQDWLTISGETKVDAAGTISFSIYRTIGGEFEEHGTRNHSVIGTGHLQMLTCDRAVLSYRFDEGFHAGQFKGLSGTQNLQKIVPCAQSF